MNNETFEQMVIRCIGITKKEIAIQMDKANPLFNYSVETGRSSYHNYSRIDLLTTCFQFGIDPESDYLKSRRIENFKSSK